MPYRSLWSVIFLVSLVSLIVFNDLFGSDCIVMFNSIYDGPCYNIICLYLPKNIEGGGGCYLADDLFLSIEAMNLVISYITGHLMKHWLTYKRVIINRFCYIAFFIHLANEQVYL